jgi:proteic killer suppression protein
VIKSFKHRNTERLWNGETVRQFSGFTKQAMRKLDMLNIARKLSDLSVPPGNRLEALSGDRKGQHSVRINGQWRVCFVWTAEGPIDVEIVDYH